MQWAADKLANYHPKEIPLGSGVRLQPMVTFGSTDKKCFETMLQETNSDPCIEACRKSVLPTTTRHKETAFDQIRISHVGT